MELGAAPDVPGVRFVAPAGAAAARILKAVDNVSAGKRMEPP
jgi:hypothetical protein